MFGAARDALGDDVADVDLPDGATIGQLRRTLAMQYPAIAALVPHLQFAVDAGKADDRTALSPSSDVAAVFPAITR